MKTKVPNKWVLTVSPVVLAFILAGCCTLCCPPPKTDICSGYGSNTAFSATFDADTVGSLPTTTSYGPPGANLEIENGANTVEVINSAVLGSKALRLSGPSGISGPERYSPTVVEGVAGDLGQGPYTSGKYYIDFTAHGDIVPPYLVYGITIAVLSEEGNVALSLGLFDGSYHLIEGDGYSKLSGSYDPGAKHMIHIKIDMDERKYSICIDDEAVVSDKNFEDGNFSNVAMVRFNSPGIVLALPMPHSYVVDDLRITK